MFETYPKINYKFISKDGIITNPEVIDIFRNVSINQKTLNDSSNFKFYTVSDGETPEMVAFKIYNDSFLWWVVLLANGIINKDEEWPKSIQEINRIFDEFLDGNSYFIVENPDIEKNDIIIKRDVELDGSVDINTFGIINDYDKNLHKIEVKTDKSEGTFEENDEFYLYRRSGVDGINWDPVGGLGLTACAVQSFGSTAGCIQILGPTDGSDGGPYGMLCATQGSTFGIIRKKATLKSTVRHFEIEGVEVDPYAVPNDSGGATGSYYLGSGQNICGLTGTILYKYIDGSLQENHPSIKVIGEGAYIIRKNDNIRKIKILSPDMTRKIIREVYALVGSSVPPGTTKYIEYNP
tara:strand:+ start:865 stop:1917 length:1053 start_codon:yes stop_codon:yes gene_type:complete